MRSKKIKIIFLTFTLLLCLACLSSIYASNTDNNTVNSNDSVSVSKSVQDNNTKINQTKYKKINVTVNKIKSNDYLSNTTVTGQIKTEDKKLPSNTYIQLYVNNKKQSKNTFTLNKNGTFKYTTKQEIGNHTFKIYINDPKYETKKITQNFTVTDKIFPTLNKSKPIYFAMDHTSKKDNQICNNIVKKLKQEGFKVVRYKIGPNAMYQNMVYLYNHKIHNAIMFHLFNGVDPSNIREVARYGNDNRGRIVRQRGNDVVLAWFYDAADPVHPGGTCYKSVRGSETSSRMYNPKEYMDKNNIRYICTSSDSRKHKSTADYTGDKTTLEFMKMFTKDTNLKYKTTTKVTVKVTNNYLVTVSGTVTYPTSTVNGYLYIKNQNNKIIANNVLVKSNKYSTSFMMKNVGKQKLTVTFKGSSLYSASSKTVTATIKVRNATINVKQVNNLVENNSVSINLRESYTKESLVNQLVKVTSNGKTTKYYTDKTGNVLAKLNLKTSQNIKINVYQDNKLINSTSFKVNAVKDNVSVKVDKVDGIIGDKIKFRAVVTDSNGNNVNGGYLYFKLNNKVLGKNNRTNTTDYLTVKVVKGVATYWLNSDFYFNNKKLSAKYNGSYKYKSSTSDNSVIVIKKRNAKMTIKATPSSNDNGKNVTLTVTVKDSKNNNKYLEKGYVVFKMNNKTVTGSNGKVIHVALDSNYLAKYTLSLDSSNVTAVYLVGYEFVNSYYNSLTGTSRFSC